MQRADNEQSPSGVRPAGRAVSMARWSAPPVVSSPEECLRQIRSGIGRVQQLLTDPTAEAMLRSEVCLREVADRLRQFPKALAKAAAAGSVDRSGLTAAAAAAKDELAHANRLFQQAGHFYGIWIRHFSALRCGYTRTGSPARLTCVAQSAVRG